MLKKILRRVVITLFAFLFTFSLMTASSVAYYPWKVPSGSRNSVTFYVTTENSFWQPSIKLKQNKYEFVFAKNSNPNKKVRRSYYGTYNVRWCEVGKSKGKKRTWKDRSTTIRLNRNTQYEITVEYCGGALDAVRGIKPWYYLESSTDPYWWMDSYNNVLF